jgi:hypothetical protein
VGHLSDAIAAARIAINLGEKAAKDGKLAAAEEAFMFARANCLKAAQVARGDLKDDHIKARSNDQRT